MEGTRNPLCGLPGVLPLIYDACRGYRTSTGTSTSTGTDTPSARAELVGQAEAQRELPPVCGLAVEGAVELQRLLDGDFGPQLALLQLGAQELGDPVVVGDRVEARDTYRAGAGDPQVLDAFDGGGLARTVGAEDPEALTSSTAKSTPSTTGLPP